MSSIPDVDALREEFRKKKEALAKKWEGSVDENGTFVAVFGDPAATPCTFIHVNTSVLTPDMP